MTTCFNVAVSTSAVGAEWVMKTILNLCLRRWLKPRRSSLRSFKPLVLWELNEKLGVSLINAKTFLKNL